MTTAIQITNTNIGNALVAMILGGTPVTFTKMSIGDGHFNGDLKTADALTNGLFEITITSQESAAVQPIGEDAPQANNAKILRGVFDSTNFDKDFYYREVGIWAIDPDSQEEVLYAYGNFGGEADLIKASQAGSQITEQVEIEAVIYVGNAANVEIYVNADLANFQTRNEKAQPNGYAPLNEEGIVPAEHLPEIKLASTVPFCPNSGSVDANGDNNSLYQPDAPTIVTKSLPIFTSVAQLQSGIDGITATPADGSTVNLLGRNASNGIRTDYNYKSVNTTTITFSEPKKLTAFTFYSVAVNNVTFHAALQSLEGYDGSTWTTLFTGDTANAARFDNYSIPNQNKYLQYRFTHSRATAGAAGTANYTVNAINLFYEDVVDAGSNVIVLKASKDTPFKYTPLNSQTKKQEAPLSITVKGQSGQANIAINNGVLEQTGKRYIQPNEPNFITDDACILEAPNGVATYNGNNLTIPRGLKFIYPDNGKWGIHTLSKDITTTAGTGTTPYDVLIFPTLEKVVTSLVSSNLVFKRTTQPATAAYVYWINPETKISKVYTTDASFAAQLGISVSTWSVLPFIHRGTLTKSSASVISGVSFSEPQNGMPMWLDTSFGKSEQPMAKNLVEVDEYVEWREGYEGVYLGSTTVTGGVITKVANFPFNFNGIGEKLIEYGGNSTWQGYSIKLIHDSNSGTIKKLIEQWSHANDLTYAAATLAPVPLIVPYDSGSNYQTQITPYGTSLTSNPIISDKNTTTNTGTTFYFSCNVANTLIQWRAIGVKDL